MINASSEIGRLERVIVHTPGVEWDMIPLMPGWTDLFLTEDIIDREAARREHGIFKAVLQSFLGEGAVFEFTTLLQDVCADDSTRSDLVAAVGAVEEIGIGQIGKLRGLEPRDLVITLVTGPLFRGDLEPENATPLFKPIPNLMFTRDLGTAIPGGFVLGRPAKEIRKREGLLARAVTRHPLFDGVRRSIIDVRDADQVYYWELGGDRVAVEGGDILVWDDKTLVVGTGERTSARGFFILLRALEGTPIERVVRVTLPEERQSMHLDTVLTKIRHDLIVHFPGVFPEAEFGIYETEPANLENVALPTSTFDQVLKEISPRRKIPTKVVCGGPHPLVQAREQWSDGTNLLVLGPDVIVGYARNKATRWALEDQGYDYLDADDGADFRKIKRLGEDFRRTGESKSPILIGIPGAELSRARGGPRCMTMPLERADARPPNPPGGAKS